MKKKMNYIKLAIDLIMAILFVVFFNTNVLGGLTFHEIAGLAFTAIFFTHIALNWKWVKSVTLKIFSKGLPTRTRIGYVLNLLLLITMAFVIISGVLISRIVFPNIEMTNEMWFQITHISISFLVLVLVAAHVGLHWKWVMDVCKRIVKLDKPNPIFAWGARIAVVALLLYGSYEISTTSFLNHLQGVTTVFGGSSATMAAGDMRGGNGNFDPSSMPEGVEGGQKPDMAQGGNFQNGDRPEMPEGFSREDFANGERPEGFAGGRGGEMGNTNVLDVIVTYTSIMSVFAIIIYYLDKLLRRLQRKRKQSTLTETEIPNLS